MAASRSATPLGRLRQKKTTCCRSRTEQARTARERVIATFAGAILLDLLLLIFAFRLLLRSVENQVQLAARAD